MTHIAEIIADALMLHCEPPPQQPRLVYLRSLGAFVPEIEIGHKRRRETGLDAAMQTDREIVARYPKLKRYVRARLANEFEPHEDLAGAGECVLVTVLSRSTRTRQTVVLDAD